jgi:hypothetical protein
LLSKRLPKCWKASHERCLLSPFFWRWSSPETVVWFFENVHGWISEYPPKLLFFVNNYPRIQLAIMNHNYSIGRNVVGVYNVLKLSTHFRKLNVGKTKCYGWMQIIYFRYFWRTWAITVWEIEMINFSFGCRVNFGFFLFH